MRYMYIILFIIRLFRALALTSAGSTTWQLGTNAAKRPWINAASRRLTKPERRLWADFTRRIWKLNRRAVSQRRSRARATSLVMDIVYYKYTVEKNGFNYSVYILHLLFTDDEESNFWKSVSIIFCTQNLRERWMTGVFLRYIFLVENDLFE